MSSKVVRHERLIPIAVAAKRTPYTADFLMLLARRGGLSTVRIGRDVLVTSANLAIFLNSEVSRKERALVDKFMTTTAR